MPCDFFFWLRSTEQPAIQFRPFSFLQDLLQKLFLYDMIVSHQDIIWFESANTVCYSKVRRAFLISV